MYDWYDAKFSFETADIWSCLELGLERRESSDTRTYKIALMGNGYIYIVYICKSLRGEI